MKFRKYVLVLLFGTLLVACKKDQPKEKLIEELEKEPIESSLKDFMVGSWQTTYLKIEMPTYQKSDSLNVYEDKFDNNPESIAQSNYKDDGTFTAWFINKNGEKVSKSNGTWSTKNDSLSVEFFYNNRQMKVNYFIEKTEVGFIGKSKYDWDEDGNFDDLLTMKTKRIQTD